MPGVKAHSLFDILAIQGACLQRIKFEASDTTRSVPSRPASLFRTCQDSQFCTHQKSGASRESPDRSEVLPVQYDVGYPSLCVPRSRQAPPPRSLPIPTKWCKDLYVSRFAAPLRRRRLERGCSRGARKRRKTLAYPMRSRLESSILRPTCRRTPLPAAEETRALPRRVLR